MSEWQGMLLIVSISSVLTEPLGGHTWSGTVKVFR